MEQEDRDRLIRMEMSLTTLVTNSGDHEKRIRSLEQGWWKQMGAVGVLTFIALKYFPYIPFGK